MRDHVYRPDASGFCQAPRCSQPEEYCTGTKPAAQSDNRQVRGRHRAVANEPPPLIPPAEVMPPARRLVLTPASAITPEPVVWAWEDNGYGRIPAGSVSLFAGREGTGKSSFLIWLAAQITRGELPGSFHGQANSVIYVAVEDSWKYTIVPRLIASGADLDLVYRAEVIRAIDSETVTLSLPADGRLLEEAITGDQVALVVLDPLMSAISDTLDTHVNRQVRQALDPLAQMADRTGAIIGGIAHFNKSGGTDPSSLITASGAFKDVARSIFAFAADDDGHVITQTKNNLGHSGLPSMAYRVIEAIVPTAKGDARVGRFVLDGQSERTVEDILSDQGSGAARDKKRQAEEYLKKALAGGPRLSDEVKEEAVEAHSISLATFKRAREDLRLPAQKRPGGWWISLPEHEGDLRDLTTPLPGETAPPAKKLKKPKSPSPAPVEPLELLGEAKREREPAKRQPRRQLPRGTCKGDGCNARPPGGADYCQACRLANTKKEEAEMRTGSRTLSGRLPKNRSARHAPAHCRNCLAEETDLDGKGVCTDREACEKRQPPLPGAVSAENLA